MSLYSCTPASAGPGLRIRNPLPSGVQVGDDGVPALVARHTGERPRVMRRDNTTRWPSAGMAWCCIKKIGEQPLALASARRRRQSRLTRPALCEGR